MDILYRSLELNMYAVQIDTPNIYVDGSRIKTWQRSLAGQMHDKLDLHPPNSTETN